VQIKYILKVKRRIGWGCYRRRKNINNGVFTIEEKQVGDYRYSKSGVKSDAPKESISCYACAMELLYRDKFPDK